MRLRDRLGRVVLILAVLTTIATSAVSDPLVEATDDRVFAPQEIGRVRVVFSDAANEQAEQMTIDLEGSAAITIIPDDPAQPPFLLGTRGTIDANELCIEAGPCDLGFSIDPGDTGGDLRVTARISRAADQSLCLPNNRDFSEDANIEVIFE